MSEKVVAGLLEIQVRIQENHSADLSEGLGVGQQTVDDYCAASSGTSTWLYPTLVLHADWRIRMPDELF
ncbi:MAG: hypothetical protein GY696_22290 [Gammaproteobacteria bacterium]|nr:hypothetical protein [Gammaproteobacteria bacterium]